LRLKFQKSIENVVSIFFAACRFMNDSGDNLIGLWSAGSMP
jgi:hypothetical protein